MVVSQTLSLPIPHMDSNFCRTSLGIILRISEDRTRAADWVREESQSGEGHKREVILLRSTADTGVVGGQGENRVSILRDSNPSTTQTSGEGRKEDEAWGRTRVQLENKRPHAQKEAPATVPFFRPRARSFPTPIPFLQSTRVLSERRRDGT